MSNTPLVSIVCSTYNHASYITQCLEGFLMQKCNFPFEILVHDDSSSDSTPNIIRTYECRYPQIIKPIYQKDNKYSRGEDIFFKYQCSRAQGKYIAICEGDDYWIDPFKLQKQVEFLEKNPQFSMCYTDIDRYNQQTGVFDDWRLSDKEIIDVSDLMRYNRVHTLTALCRRDLVLEYNKIITPILPQLPMGDYPMWIWMAYQAPIYHMRERAAVYRVLQESASHSCSEKKMYNFSLAGYDLRLFYNELFKLKCKTLRLRRMKFVLTYFLKHLDCKILLNDLFK